MVERHFRHLGGRERQHWAALLRHCGCEGAGDGRAGEEAAGVAAPGHARGGRAVHAHLCAPAECQCAAAVEERRAAVDHHLLAGCRRRGRHQDHSGLAGKLWRGRGHGDGRRRGLLEAGVRDDARQHAHCVTDVERGPGAKADDQRLAVAPHTRGALAQRGDGGGVEDQRTVGGAVEAVGVHVHAGAVRGQAEGEQQLLEAVREHCVAREGRGRHLAAGAEPALLAVAVAALHAAHAGALTGAEERALEEGAVRVEEAEAAADHRAVGGEDEVEAVAAGGEGLRQLVAGEEANEVRFPAVSVVDLEEVEAALQVEALELHRDRLGAVHVDEELALDVAGIEEAELVVLDEAAGRGVLLVGAAHARLVAGVVLHLPAGVQRRLCLDVEDKLGGRRGAHHKGGRALDQLWLLEVGLARVRAADEAVVAAVAHLHECVAPGAGDLCANVELCEDHHQDRVGVHAAWRCRRVDPPAAVHGRHKGGAALPVAERAGGAGHLLRGAAARLHGPAHGAVLCLEAFAKVDRVRLELEREGVLDGKVHLGELALPALLSAVPCGRVVVRGEAELLVYNGAVEHV
mmetsp:Transcript_3316/g.11644  ORF Transcript_3316/g.11644 Transcript_3316/m.11644 type:complete len:575 (-) Transcript_3316:342-2066(-)